MERTWLAGLVNVAQQDMMMGKQYRVIVAVASTFLHNPT